MSRESIFSDLNNLAVVTTTTDQYADCFGFTEVEVFAGMHEMGLCNRAEVKEWYDGFSFGSVRDIYNPWSITNYLKYGEASPYWANTSGNVLVDRLVREGGIDLKSDLETLLRGASIHKELDEQVVYGELGRRSRAVWSLLLANGYLKVLERQTGAGDL